MSLFADWLEPVHSRLRVCAALGTLLFVFGCASAGPRMEPATPYQKDPASETFHYSETVDVNYEEVGSGRRTVIFLHGFASSIRNWDDVRDRLDVQDSRLVFVDLKGFGLSSRARDNRYSLRTQAAIVQAFIEERGYQSIALVGHSYGGAVALMLTAGLEDAGRHGLVERLVLIDSAAYAKHLPLFIDLLRSPVLGRLTTWLLPRRQQLGIMLRKAFFDNRRLTPEILDRYLRFYRLPGSRYSLRKAARQAVPENHTDLERRYQELEVPVYLIWGGRDRMLRLEKIGRRLARELRARRFEIIEDCGHIPQEEKPAETAAILSQFFADLQ